MEDGKYVRLSLSKLFMWLSMIQSTYVMLYSIDNMAAVVAAAGTNFIAVANYQLRRQQFEKTGKVENVDMATNNWQDYYGPRNKFPDYSARLGASGQRGLDSGV